MPFFSPTSRERSQWAFWVRAWRSWECRSFSSTSWTSDPARGRSDRWLLVAIRTVSALLGSKVLVGVALSLLGLLVTAPLGQSAYPVSAFVCLAVARSAVMTLQVPSQAAGDFGRVAVAQVIDRWSALISIVALHQVRLSQGLLLPVALLSGSLVGGLYLLSRDAHPWLDVVAGARVPSQVFRLAPAFAVTSCVTDLVGLDVLVIQLVLGSEKAGIFALPSRLVGPASTVTLSLAAALFPALARAPSYRQAIRLLWAATKLPILLVTVVLGTVGVCAPTIIAGAFGTRYLAAIVPMRFYIVAAILASVGQLCQALLQARGKEAYVAGWLALSAILGLGGIVLGAAVSGVVGASVAFLLAALVTTMALASRVAAVIKQSVKVVSRCD